MLLLASCAPSSTALSCTKRTFRFALKYPWDLAHNHSPEYRCSTASQQFCVCCRTSIWRCSCIKFLFPGGWRGLIYPGEVPLPALGLCCCTIFLHSSQSRRGLVCLQTGPVSTWKWYKSTVVQEAFAISSVLRHKRITVPLTQTTTTWDPVQHWNFPTDKNTLTVQSYKLTELGRAVAVIPSMNEPLLSSTCRVFIGTNEVQCLCKSSPVLYYLYQMWLSIEYFLCPEKFLTCYWCFSCTGFQLYGFSLLYDASPKHLWWWLV